jgi:hypothetical protein
LQAGAGHGFDKQIVAKQIALLSIVLDAPSVKTAFKFDNTIRHAEMKL